MTNEFDWERLARYVSGEASAAERTEIERWAATDPANRAMLDSLGQRWAAARATEAWNVDAAWSRLSSRLHEADVATHDRAIHDRAIHDRAIHDRAAPAPVSGDHAASPAPARVLPLDSRRPRRLSLGVLLPVAATLILAVGIATIWRARTAGPEATTTMTAAPDLMATGVGERRTIDLPDGSQVVLGAASSIRYEAAASGERRVYLEGQALFRVTHDSTRPFSVHARGTVTEDLGTEFDIRAYAGERDVRVAVVEGAVAVRRPGATDTTALLRPRDVAVIDTTGASVMVLHDQNVDRLLAWTRGELFFDDATVSDVCDELERWYDVDCRVSSTSIASRRYSGDFRGEALEEVLRVIDLTLPDVVIERQGRTVTFSPGRGVGRTMTPAPSRIEVGA